MKIKKMFIISGLIALTLSFFWKPIGRTILCKMDPLCRLENAWNNKDTLYFQDFTTRMNELDFPDVAISSIMLSEATNVSFGEYDRRENWEVVPSQKKAILKNNLVHFWTHYTSSQALFKKGHGYINLNSFLSDHEKLDNQRLDSMISIIVMGNANEE